MLQDYRELEEDPRRQIILASYVFYIQLKGKKLYLSLIALTPPPPHPLGSSKLRGTGILHHVLKLLSLVRSSY